MNKNIKKSLHWLLRHALTVFSCVAIIALGMGAIAYSNTSTTIGENISTGGTLTVFSNSTLATTTISGGDLTVDTNTLFVDSINNRVGIGTINLSYYKLNVNGDISGDEIRFNPRKQQALVTFVFDDGYGTDYTIMKPVFDAQGEVACSAVVSDNVGVGTGLNSAQLVEMQTDGWEILSHSKTHTSLTTLSEAEIRTELSDSKSALEAMGFTVKNFAYPYGSNNETVRRITSEYYRSARATEGIGTNTGINPYMLETYDLRAISADDHTKLATYKTYVDTATSKEKWLIFYMHKTDSNDAAAVNELIDYIQSKNVSIVTIDQALDLVGNVIEVGDNVAIGNKGIRINSDLGIGTSYRVDPGLTGFTRTLTVYSGTVGSQTGIEIVGNRNAANQSIAVLSFHNTSAAQSNKRVASINALVGNTGDLDSAQMVFHIANTSGALMEAMRITEGSKVGIGTTTPALKLDLYGGAMRAFNTASSTCDSTTRGSTFYNEASDSFWGCKTTGWVKLDN